MTQFIYGYQKHKGCVSLLLTQGCPLKDTSTVVSSNISGAPWTLHYPWQIWKVLWAEPDIWPQRQIPVRLLRIQDLQGIWRDKLKKKGGAYFLIKYLFLIESHHGLQRYPMVLAMDTLASGFFAASAGPVLHQKNSHLFTQCLYFIIQGSDP